MGSSSYIPARTLRWYLVNRKEHVGGGTKVLWYAVQAYNATEAARITFNDEKSWSHAEVVSVSVEHADIVCIPYGEKEEV